MAAAAAHGADNTNGGCRYLGRCLHTGTGWNTGWKSTRKTGMRGTPHVSFLFGSLVRPHQDTRKRIPHLAVTSTPGPGTQLQRPRGPPRSRAVQKDGGGAGPALPWLPELRPEPRGWSLQPRPHPLEARERTASWKVAKAAFLWTTQEMYVRKPFLVLFLSGPSAGFPSITGCADFAG